MLIHNNLSKLLFLLIILLINFINKKKNNKIYKKYIKIYILIINMTEILYERITGELNEINNNISNKYNSYHIEYIFDYPYMFENIYENDEIKKDLLRGISQERIYSIYNILQNLIYYNKENNTLNKNLFSRLYESLSQKKIILNENNENIDDLSYNNDNNTEKDKHIFFKEILNRIYEEKNKYEEFNDFNLNRINNEHLYNGYIKGDIKDENFKKEILFRYFTISFYNNAFLLI